MRLMVFTVYDKAVQAYMQPFFCRSKGEAIRNFTETCADKNHIFYKCSLDFSLMELGEFDDASGQFVSIDPVRVVGANECLPDEPLPPVDREVREVSRRLPM